MNLQRVDNRFLRLGLESDLLDPEPSGRLRAPVILDAHDAAQMLVSFQQLVYFTAAYSANKMPRNLTGVEREQFAVIPTAIEIASFKFKLEFQAGANIVLDNTVDWVSHVTLNLQVLFDAGHSEHRRSNTMSDLVPEVLTLIGSAIPVVMHPQDPAGMVGYALSAMGTLYKIALSLNHVLTMEQEQRSLKPSKQQMESVVKADKELHSAQRSTEERPGFLERGGIVSVDLVHACIYVRFPRYAEPIKCVYGAHDLGVLSRLQAGDGISISGRAVHMRGDADAAQPQFVVIEDFSELHHNHDSYFKT